jgi:hypothetical protein
VRLSPTSGYVVRREHVNDALKRVPDDVRDVTVWIHSSTLGIDDGCFREMTRVSRILVWGPEPEPPAIEAAVLRLFIAKLAAYEPALVYLIRNLVTRMSEMCRVGLEAFRGCSALNEVVLPGSITHVGDSAFYKCTSLTSVTLPNSLTHIGDSAFTWCTSLTSVTLPDSLTHVGVSAFFRCSTRYLANVGDTPRLAYSPGRVRVLRVHRTGTCDDTSCATHSRAPRLPRMPVARVRLLCHLGTSPHAAAAQCQSNSRSHTCTPVTHALVTYVCTLETCAMSIHSSTQSHVSVRCASDD